MKRTIILSALLILALSTLQLIGAIHTETIEIEVETESTECVQTLLEAFENKKGIINTSFNKETKTLTVEYDPHRITLDTVYKWVITTHNTTRVKVFDGTPKPNCCSK